MATLAVLAVMAAVIVAGLGWRDRRVRRRHEAGVAKLRSLILPEDWED